jgi:hypothetical protein
MRRTTLGAANANTQTRVIVQDDTDEEWTSTTPPRSPGRDGKTYTYWTRRDVPYVIGMQMGQMPVADRRQIIAAASAGCTGGM